MPIFAQIMTLHLQVMLLYATRARNQELNEVLIKQTQASGSPQLKWRRWGVLVLRISFKLSYSKLQVLAQHAVPYHVSL